MIMVLNLCFTAVTAIVAIIAIFQTNQQIKLSNKQHLFDKRVEQYIVAEGLIQLYENNQNLLSNEEDEPIFAIDFIFQQMTNNTYLEKIGNVINHPLEQPYHKEFLVKMEMLKDVSAKIKYVFNGKAAVFLGDYVLRYQEVLLEMYHYQILLGRMNALQDKMTLDKAQETVKEKRYRDDLQKTIDNLKQAYDILKKEKMEEKIEKQIKLN